MVYKIFIVEDDKVISQKMAEFLSSWNYQVRQVHDFSKIMEEFIAFDPDLILMDITLPHLNGYHWTLEIRKFSKVPILFVSSANDDMNIVMAISQGADDYITKPFDLQVLAAKILRLLLERKNSIVSRDDLMEYLWKTDYYVDENALSVNVNRLRKKLEQIDVRDFIITKKGIGYLV